MEIRNKAGRRGQVNWEWQKWQRRALNYKATCFYGTFWKVSEVRHSCRVPGVALWKTLPDPVLQAAHVSGKAFKPPLTSFTQTPSKSWCQLNLKEVNGPFNINSDNHGVGWLPVKAFFPPDQSFAIWHYWHFGLENSLIERGLSCTL